MGSTPIIRSKRKNCAFARFQNKFEKRRSGACFFSICNKSHFIGDYVAIYLSKKTVPSIEKPWALAFWLVFAFLSEKLRVNICFRHSRPSENRAKAGDFAVAYL